VRRALLCRLRVVSLRLSGRTLWLNYTQSLAAECRAMGLIGASEHPERQRPALPSRWNTSLANFLGRRQFDAECANCDWQ
jgi:hypothetical protein